MPLNNDDLTFLARLAKSPDGRTLQRILRAKLSEADTVLRNARGEETFRAQGKSQTLAGLINEIDSAQDKLDHNEQSPSRGKRPVVQHSAGAPYQNLS